ncbi:MAG: patatin-like phospholipase family protein [Rikenellaceae bacterium]|jgi:NTE family protein|nr:patatin-like phospholipase family protein [Rikenellaceae bacterium]
MKTVRYIVIVLLVGLCGRTAGQSVGLVLSGGGAKGLYHVGVIKALEENEIPIDYITGTSMGAIIGGMYAIGLTPEEMTTELTSPQLENWITGTIDDDNRYYFKEMHRSAAMMNLRLNPARKQHPSLSSSYMVTTGQLDVNFIKFFAAPTAACGGDFDRLMTPFRCITSDIEARKAVTVRHGDLGKAIRASMSIPFIFNPLDADSASLYDGGLFNNFPWQVMDKEFAPDIIIGSRCVPSNKNFNNLNLFDQLFFLTMLSTDYDLPPERGVLIDRIMEGVSTLDFSRAREIISLGYYDTMAKIDQIKAAIARRRSTDEVAARRKAFRALQPPLLFGSFKIEGLDWKQRIYVPKLLGIKNDGVIFDFDYFNDHYFNLLAEDFIFGEYPDVTFNPATGYFDMKIRMKKKWGFKAMIGGNISSTALNQAYIGLEYRHIGRASHRYNLDGYLSPFYTSASLAFRSDFFIKTKPFYYEAATVYNHYNYFRSNFGYISRIDNMSYAKHNDMYFTVAFGWPIGRKHVANIRVNGVNDQYNYYLNSNYVESDPMDRTIFKFIGIKAEIERNSIENSYSITGVSQSLSGIAIDGSEAFAPATNGVRQRERLANRIWLGARFSREQYIPMRWFTLGYSIDAVVTNHPGLANDYSTNMTLPSFNPTPHSNIVYMKEFRSSSFLAAGVIPSFEFIPNFYLKCGAYAFLPAFYDSTIENIRQRLRYIFDASLVYQTQIGPASLSLSKYDVSRNNWFLTFNFGLTLFNKKGLFY